MFERSKRGENALLIQPHPAGQFDAAVLEEFTELARSAGATVCGSLNARMERPNPALLIGTGKVEEARDLCEALGADLVLVNHALTPVQERNLEKALSRRVVDRTGLILDIFAQRARSHEGKLQVELAQLRHMGSRLVRGWTHLDSQRGGSIGLRGPGETQLETDRRLLQKRVEILLARLAKVEVQRTQMRRARLRNDVPRVALVGYTNAGKSTLFNALTGANAYVADKLFATLDPTVRRLEGLVCGPVVLSDTVGFVRDLPHDLVAAFRSTLSEARDADLLLHVVDASDPLRNERIEQVDAVLKEIGADEIPQLLVFNKIDLLPVRGEPVEPPVRGEPVEPPVRGEPVEPPVPGEPQADRVAVEARVDALEGGERARVWVSARTGAGLTLLKETISTRFERERIHRWVRLPSNSGRLRARLFEAGAVVSENADETGWSLELDLPLTLAEQLCTTPDAEVAALRGQLLAAS